VFEYTGILEVFSEQGEIIGVAPYLPVFDDSVLSLAAGDPVAWAADHPPLSAPLPEGGQPEVPGLPAVSGPAWLVGSIAKP
jgi:hypothetical protein